MDLMTPRLRIRTLDLDRDVPDLLALYDDPEAMRFIGGERFSTVEAASAFLRRRLARCRPAPLGFWAVALRDGGRVIGTALLDGVPASAPSADPVVMSDAVQIGVALCRDAWRQGHALEIGTALLDWADGHGVTGVVAMAEPAHAASLALMDRLGFGPAEASTAYYGGIPMQVRRAPGASGAALTTG